jgi:DNA mismatch endonuclease (patch repair protein)
MDTRTPEQRRRIMQSVRQKDTAPELAVRRGLHALGYRFRLHTKDLPGRPDLVFPSRRRVIFVHGCFWHGHDCPKGRLPASRLDYWRPKVAANKERDERTVNMLERAGWRCFVVWQCQTRDIGQTVNKIVDFLGPARVGKPNAI